MPVPAETLGAEHTDQLGAGDILFIDSSHTVRIGGDVVHLFCEVIPRLAPGVIVHVHDIYLPYEYPRAWVEQLRWYWAEQYLLQALLAGNPRLRDPGRGARALARAARAAALGDPQSRPRALAALVLVSDHGWRLSP